MNYKLFENVLNQIERKDIRDFTVLVLKMPLIFLTMFLSVSGKYHPEDATKTGGLVWHVKRACWFANMFFGAFKWELITSNGYHSISTCLMTLVNRRYVKITFKYKPSTNRW